MDSQQIANVLGRLDRELWLVTASDGSHRGGLIATFVAEASIVPELPRVLLGLAKQHFTWELVEASGAFAMHLIRPKQREWVWRFGLQSGRDTDKFQGLDYRIGETGSPILNDAPAWLDCRVEARLDTGDRTVYLAEVVAGNLEQPGPILTVHRLLEEAPPEKRQELKEQRLRDSHVDAEAICTWRSGQRRTGSSR